MEADPKYSTEVTAAIPENIKKHGSVDNVSSDMRSQSYTGNPNWAFAYPQGATPANKRHTEEFYSDLANMAFSREAMLMSSRVPGALMKGVESAKTALARKITGQNLVQKLVKCYHQKNLRCYMTYVAGSIYDSKAPILDKLKSIEKLDLDDTSLKGLVGKTKRELKQTIDPLTETYNS